jgi:myosin-crossreactive antigen
MRKIIGTYPFPPSANAGIATTSTAGLFSPSYKIPNLDFLEQFLKINRHLPEIPSAENVEKDGIDLGNNQPLLLKKIEELTLMVIKQNNTIKEQNKRIQKLEMQIIR